ncbi:hypothetical protein A1Q1_05762 [Trichosporon asahii var. asahii CBS 2479]|uniref:Uncharacterized protein n=1 Tax=Trichosporon asahii var. asahii (strain ATCC 90039 / CBS 2479 / JCM 2466 / KCTC 7840 / NBRC 103889/ NCYC 2677 / UAMH 7654) TaxID=1186058 RepID=J5Q5S2_TRIAS|nr:hypothetical protein A1Q1_05762 [Trichosporon asahii var. asahii CBS 2479]EJT45613.1 hypothetical protein A1Q1_05762 [Trichosporon asahii var. asahii CBS 2479]
MGAKHSRPRSNGGRRSHSYHVNVPHPLIPIPINPSVRFVTTPTSQFTYLTWDEPSTRPHKLDSVGHRPEQRKVRSLSAWSLAVSLGGLPEKLTAENQKAFPTMSRPPPARPPSASSSNPGTFKVTPTKPKSRPFAAGSNAERPDGPFAEAIPVRRKNGRLQDTPLQLVVFGLSDHQADEALEQVKRTLRQMDAVAGGLEFEDLVISPNDRSSKSKCVGVRVECGSSGWLKDIDLQRALGHVRKHLVDNGREAYWASSTGVDRRNVGVFSFERKDPDEPIRTTEHEAVDFARDICRSLDHYVVDAVAHGFDKKAKEDEAPRRVVVTMKRADCMDSIQKAVAERMKTDAGKALDYNVTFARTRTMIPVSTPATIVGLNRGHVDGALLLKELRFWRDEYNTKFGEKQEILSFRPQLVVGSVLGHAVVVLSSVGLAQYIAGQESVSGCPYELAVVANRNELRSPLALAEAEQVRQASERRGLTEGVEELKASTAGHLSKIDGRLSQVSNFAHNFKVFGKDLIQNLRLEFQQLQHESEYDRRITTESVRWNARGMEVEAMRREIQLLDKLIAGSSPDDPMLKERSERLELLRKEEDKALDDLEDLQSSIAALTKQRSCRIALVDNTGLGLLQPVQGRSQPSTATPASSAAGPSAVQAPATEPPATTTPPSADAASAASPSGTLPPGHPQPTPPRGTAAKKPRNR